MPIIFQYLIKLSISLAIMYIFYILVLRRLTFYNHNRWYLFGYSVLCYFISLINIGPILEQSGGNGYEIMNFVPSVGSLATGVYTGSVEVQEGAGGWSMWNSVMLVLGIGVIVLITRLVLQFISFKRLQKKATLIAGDGVRFYQVNRRIIPFSFGRSIYINQDLHTESELKEIIRHEFVHVKQMHTLDIIWAELLCILNWYNPFAWLIKKAIRQNLEFIADNKVIANGVDKKQYQYLLLKVIGNNHFSIASQFNFSSLKKRIVMMNKIKTARVHLFKFLFILPLLAVLLLAFRGRLNKEEENAIWLAELTHNSETGNPLPGVTAGNTVKAAADTVPAGTWQMGTALERTYTLHRDDQMSDHHKNFFERNTKVNLLHWKKDGSVEVYLKGGTVRQYSKASDFKKFESEYGPMPDPAGSSAAVVSPAYPPPPPSPPSHALPASPAEPQSPPAPPAKGVTVQPNNGRASGSGSGSGTGAGSGSGNGSGHGFNLNLQVKNAADKPVVYVNGQEWPADISLDVIDPVRIESINVFKGESAVRLYGNNAKQGAIVIVTKENLEKVFDVKVLQQPVYYLNGKKISKEAVDLINPMSIQSIDVLKGNDAIKKYGDDGKNGVIEITVPVTGTNPQINKSAIPARDFRNKTMSTVKDAG